MTNAVDESAIPEAFREPSQEQKTEKKPRQAKQQRDGGAAKAKSGKKATPKPPKGEKKTGAAREGSKSATVLGLIQRTKGATLAEIMEATGWQAYSVRGFISGTMGKKMGLKVESTKREDGTRVYNISK